MIVLNRVNLPFNIKANLSLSKVILSGFFALVRYELSGSPVTSAALSYSLLIIQIDCSWKWFLPLNQWEDSERILGRLVHSYILSKKYFSVLGERLREKA